MDGYGSELTVTNPAGNCTDPGYSEVDTDCDDHDPFIYPGASEYCNGFDDDCDGVVDNDYAVNAVTWYSDLDGDGYGDPAVSVTQCEAPPGYVSNGTDNCPDISNPGQEDEDFDGHGDDCDCNNLAIATYGATPGGLLGCAVGGGGDINGDGLADMLVGEEGDDFSVGRVYVFFGAAGLNLGTVSAADADIVITGVTTGGRLGGAVASIVGEEANEILGEEGNDFNGDGWADMILGEEGNDINGPGAGAVYVFLGGPSLPSTLLAANADIIIYGDAAGDRLGCAVAWAGDVNNDGYGDFLTGEEGHDFGGIDAGAVALFLGGPGPFPTTMSASDADVVFQGDQTEGFFGRALAGAGDINGDGFADCILGEEGNDFNGTDAGRVCVFFGGGGLASSIPASSADITIYGSEAGDKLGSAVGGAVDINGDGYMDMLTGEEGHDILGEEGNDLTDAGGVLVFLGGSYTPSGVYYGGDKDYIFVGHEIDGYFGSAIAGVGDINHDGYGDFLTGEEGHDILGEEGNDLVDVGRAYLFYGGPGPYPDPIPAASANMVITGTVENGHLGRAVSGAGDVNGDGFADMLTGEEGHDFGGANAGRVLAFTNIGACAAPGVGVVVERGPITVVFDGITSPGTVYTQPIDCPSIPGGTIIIGPDPAEGCQEITTDATFSGTFTVSIAYDINDVPDCPAGVDCDTNQGSLTLIHYDGEVWTDVKDSHDKVNCVITSVPLTSFSVFAIALPSQCACDCHADPQCDAQTNVLDVVHAVNVAFRGSLDIVDPNSLCPYTTTDVDCGGYTDVIDVVKFVNVAFRGGDPGVQFCDPCAE